MKKIYHCSMWYKDSNSDLVLEILKEEKIKYDDIGNSFVFQVCSDHKRVNEIIEKLEHPPIILSVIFSDEEMESANWYTFRTTRLNIDTSDEDYTFEYSCPYQSSIGIRYCHQKQVRPYLCKRTPNWKNNYNFCGTSSGDFNRIFCSDLAKKMIQNRGITGIDFRPVTNRRGDPTANVHQLVYPNILPRSVFDFIGEYKEQVCPTCGLVKYIFKKPNDDNIRLRTDLIPPGIDVFAAEMTVNGGWIWPPIIVSKKVYNLVVKEMQEKHVSFYPVG